MSGYGQNAQSRYQQLLIPFKVGMIVSDECGSYSRKVLKDKYLTSRIFTKRIERNNLTLRNHIKCMDHKTICFSWSIELHEKVIGAFIEKYMFYLLESLPALVTFLSLSASSTVAKRHSDISQYHTNRVLSDYAGALY
ncbi:hypothetical protein KGP16_11080 [Serratia sp. JSRIV006]|nr:hypothetical protein KGP16_11080 [Serratia sp. JSRIV006]